MMPQFQLPKLRSMTVIAGVIAATMTATLPDPAAAAIGTVDLTRSTGPVNGRIDEHYDCVIDSSSVKNWHCNISGLKLYSKKSRGKLGKYYLECKREVNGRFTYWKPTSVNYAVLYRGPQAKNRTGCSMNNNYPTDIVATCHNNSSNHFVFNILVNCAQ